VIEDVQPGDWIEGPFWDAAVQVVGLEACDGYDALTVAGRDREPSRTCVLTPSDWEHITRATRADRRHIRFSGDPFRFRRFVWSLSSYSSECGTIHELSLLSCPLSRERISLCWQCYEQATRFSGSD